jgi:hypothetical protein
MLIGSSKDEPDVADLVRGMNPDSEEGEEDNEEGMDLDLEGDEGVVEEGSDEEEKK